MANHRVEEAHVFDLCLHLATIVLDHFAGARTESGCLWSTYDFPTGYPKVGWRCGSVLAVKNMFASRHMAYLPPSLKSGGSAPKRDMEKGTPMFARDDRHFTADRDSWLTQLVRMKVFGRSPINLYFRINRRLWTILPEAVTRCNPVRSYGVFLHTLIRLTSIRRQLPHTYFLRNRPALELLRRLVEKRTKADTLKVAVLGCSAGAEAYSVAWRIRSARPDLRLILQAVDISQQAIEVARCGAYSPEVSQITGTDIFDHMTEFEIEQLFDGEGDVLTIKSWIKEVIEWHVGDVRDSAIHDAMGPQDIVVANNFLCHMNAPEAEKCLRNIAQLVRPNGYLFVSGIDLDIRMRAATDLGWTPVEELIEEVHYGDSHMTGEWPWSYSSSEPLDKKRKDWRLRYAQTFQLSGVGRISEKPGGG